jgi:cell wall-associated NlpC family hydrolase
MRTAAVFCAFFVPVLALQPRSALSTPILPVDRPAIDAPTKPAASVTSAAARVDVAGDAVTLPSGDIKISAHVGPRRMLADFAMKLRNIAYVHGGSQLTTGFDCSGFVRYVFEQSLGAELPTNSASQFQAGDRVDRDDLKMGDLVFFRTQGRRVSHVGIYLDNGLFIHSPSRGKRVRIDHLDGKYWAKRFVGARRPDALTS